MLHQHALARTAHNIRTRPAGEPRESNHGPLVRTLYYLTSFPLFLLSATCLCALDHYTPTEALREALDAWTA